MVDVAGRLRGDVKDPRTFQLLEVARQILTSHYEDAQALLGELGETGP